MAQFRTRARALDLLGRQQIAGIPTAINELIKNAHDAYADNFDIDFFRYENLLILRDNGLGMTKDEFETRWLTLGTESKLSGSTLSMPPVDPGKPKRAIMGEKGIGRLAIASIGSQVLIVTKSKNTGDNAKVVVAFINWGIFELPGINLEDIVIPVVEFDELPTSEEINMITNEVISSLTFLYDRNLISHSDYARIRTEIKSFDVNPYELSGQLYGSYPMSSNNGGTHFYISPVYETLISDIEGDGSSEEATKMEKMLMGFHNTMTPNHPKPVVDIAFRDYRSSDGSFVSIIDKEHFFTPNEFELADHHIQGEFDQYGQFKGTIRIYGEKSYDHIINWRDNNYRETECGPFKINLAYLQGELKSSRVDIENYAMIRAKGDKFGGLYIYKDNIRVLPYGDSDYDFLDIEKNRSKRASTYFFSYRRMFGAIDITNNQNAGLVEKAGREGFIENKAYRQLQAILKNFFIQLAADFFDDKKGTPQSEFYIQKKDELNTYHKALERRDKLAKGRKEKFAKALESFFERLAEHKFDNDINGIISNFRNQLNSVIHMVNPDDASQRIIDIEYEVRQKIVDYKKTITISSPKGFALSKSLRLDFDTYLNEFKLLEQGLFKDAIAEVDSLIEEYTQRLNIEISKRKRLEHAVELISTEAMSINKKKKNETLEIITGVSQKIKELTNDLIIDLDTQIRSVKNQFKYLATHETEDFDLVQERQHMENQIESISIRNTDVMERIIRQFESFYIEKNEDGQIITNDQIADAASEELEELRERLQTDIELSQLGLAVGILHHEFHSTVTSIRHSLKDLKAWSDVDQKLEGIYKNIKINFEHLDGYLNLFTPLNRRLNRRREDISLLDIKAFLIDLFKSRLERHEIAFKHTNGFASCKLHGFRSTFYPVFVNIIDNAIYWLKQSNVQPKTIRLHADENAIYISNNGPEIKLQDWERVFELQFTRKPNGRGLGLNISKEVLNAEGYEISVVPPREGSTVTFKIQKAQNK